MVGRSRAFWEPLFPRCYRVSFRTSSAAPAGRSFYQRDQQSRANLWIRTDAEREYNFPSGCDLIGKWTVREASLRVKTCPKPARKGAGPTSPWLRPMTAMAVLQDVHWYGRAHRRRLPRLTNRQHLARSSRRGPPLSPSGTFLARSQWESSSSLHHGCVARTCNQHWRKFSELAHERATGQRG